MAPTRASSIPRVVPLHFTNQRKLAPGGLLDGVAQAQHEAVWRLKTGGAPLPASGIDAEYSVWDVMDGGAARFSVWVTSGAELVAFVHGTATVVNYTIQSGLELDDEYGFSAREWTHDCRSPDDCEGCGLPR